MEFLKDTERFGETFKKGEDENLGTDVEKFFGKLLPFIERNVFGRISKRVNFLLTRINGQKLELIADGNSDKDEDGNWRVRETGGNLIIEERISGTWTERFRIDTNGNVGIGTTTPSQKLHVYSASGVPHILLESGDDWTSIGIKGGAVGDVEWALMSGFPSAGDFTIREAGVANYLTIKKTTGNVGINTVNPDAKLEVAGDMLFSGANSGLPFGEISVVSNAVETVITTQNVYVQITIFDTNGENNNATPDHTNDHITITKAGRYFISCSITLNSIGGAGSTAEIEVKKNNGVSRVGALHVDRTLAGGGAESGAITLTGFANLAGPVSATRTTYAFVDSNPDTITDSSNNFVNDGFLVGQKLTVTGTANNNGDYTIATVAAGTITLIAADALTAESAGASMTLEGSETIEVWIKNETNTQNYVVEDITLSLMQIGG